MRAAYPLRITEGGYRFTDYIGRLGRAAAIAGAFVVVGADTSKILGPEYKEYDQNLRKNGGIAVLAGLIPWLIWSRNYRPTSS